MDFSQKDQFFMREALKLATKGMSWTNPHPMVGAIIVKEDKIIAQGYHHRFGDEHAEADAIMNATANLRGGIMYVTLEPCHLPYDLHGKRIPCYEYIRQSGIKKVHIAMLDSNQEVSGKGRVMLENAGILTTLGCREQEALQLNEMYHHFMTYHSPFIIITFSASLDGKIATSTGDSKWITNKKARSYARKLRSTCQAILVGKNTILNDNPHLGCRNKKYKDPIRIILDSKLSIPLDFQVFRDSNVIIATTHKASQEKINKLQRKGIKVMIFKERTIPVNTLVHELAKIKIISILVEGGSEVIGSFIDKKLINKAYIFQAPILIGGSTSKSAIAGRGARKITEAMKLKNIRYKQFGDNILTYGFIPS